jgi:hypothetical protein
MSVFFSSAMLNKFAWTCIIGIIVFLLNADSQIISFLTPFLAVLTIWILGDGILVATDLRTSEYRIKDLETRLKTITERHDMWIAELIKNAHENHQLMLELRTRILQIHANIKRQQPRVYNSLE